MDNQPDQTKSQRKLTRWEIFLLAVYFLIALTALGVALYMLARPASPEIQKQAILWFLIAVASVLILVIAPYLKEFSIKYGEVNLSFSQIERLNENLGKVTTGFSVQRIFDYLEGSIDLTQEQISESINSCNSPTALDAIFAVTATLRERIVMDIIDLPFPPVNSNYSHQFGRFIPVLEALINTRRNNEKGRLDRHHQYMAQLAYIYKDMNYPKVRADDWEKAYNCIQKAIELRFPFKDKHLPFHIYEFNRLVCCVNNRSLCPDDQQLVDDFEKVWGNASTRFMLFDTNPKIIGGIVRDHKTALQLWIEQLARGKYLRAWNESNEELNVPGSEIKTAHRPSST